MSTAPQTIVIIDDNELASELLSEFLAMLGHEVKVAATGSQAMAVCQQTRPHIVIVDIILPDMDGHALARTLRDTLDPAPVCIAMSGLPKTSPPCGEEVFDAWLEKPADLSALEKLIAGIASRTH